MLAAVWSALGGSATAVDSLAVDRRGPVLASPLAVEELLVASAGSALLAAAELAEARTGRAPDVALDVDRLAVAAVSERYARLNGHALGPAFDPLSAFFRAGDGWVRTHGNYPWHRDALLRALGEDVRAGVAERRAVDVEEQVFAAGGCAVAVRDAATWNATEQGRAAAEQPLVARDAGPATERPLPAPGALPASGLRVLDFTRVIAGPVGTRMLAALGAHVTRVEFPERPELPLAVLDGGVGKRWVELDLRTNDAREVLERELAASDVVVTGYRPGALDAFGLDPDALAERHPHVVAVTLSAWGDRGPWAHRRGFDSLVQAATGIAETVRPGSEHEPPGALPVQALDHATGYLIAAAALRALADRARTGHAGRARLALAATSRALLTEGTRPMPENRDVDASPHLVELDLPEGRVRVALPPGTIDGRPLGWPEKAG